MCHRLVEVHTVTVLVTGGSGFIGRHLADAFHAAGDTAVVTRHHRPVDRPELPGELDGAIVAVQVDVTDVDQVHAAVTEHRIESIVHLASPSLDATYCGSGIGATVAGLVSVMEVARSVGLARVSIASSVSVYSGASALPWREDAPLVVGAGDPIGALKRATEELACYYADRTGLDLLVLRIGEVYGPLYRSMRNYPSRVAHAAAGRPDEHAAGSAIGVRGHDYCYVKDCAEAIRLLHVNPRLRHRVYNVGGGSSVDDLDVLGAARAVRPDARYERSPTPRDESLDSSDDQAPGLGAHMDLGRIREATGFVPRYDTDLGMAEYIEWLGDHES